MSNIHIFSDSAADMSEAFYQQHQIGLVSFYVTFDKVQFYKERVDIQNDAFYRKLRSENVFPSTSQPSINDYETAFRPVLAQGMDIICICLSSKFSGSYQSAVNARHSLAEQFPERRIAVIDSIQATCGEGLILSEIVRMRDRGMDLDMIVATVEKLKKTALIYFTLDSLEYLQKGGRIGKAASLIGTLLQIKPIIAMKEGELIPILKTRGRKNGLKKVSDLALEKIQEDQNAYRVIVVHSDCRDEAQALQEQLAGKGLSMDFPVQELGITIGAHTGPTLIGISFVKKYETCL